MAGLNKVQLIGRLGKDPEARSFESGTNMTTFSVATSETWKDKATGEKREATEWHNVVAWGALADTCKKYLKKGSQVFVEGKIRTRSWEKDGVTRYTTEVFIDTMLMLGDTRTQSHEAPPPPSAPKPGAQPQRRAEPATAADGTLNNPNDDLPF